VILIALAAITACGLIAGFLLLFRAPVLAHAGERSPAQISVVIPARNEEHNLPRLLDSLPLNHAKENPAKTSLVEAVVINDHSTDRTAEVASAHGARVLNARPLPAGWTGKTWACAQGAEAATAKSLLFLDADTWFESGGFEKLASAGRENLAFSLIPFHRTEKPYEELSILFHLLMVFGAGGFGALGKARLFGQCLLIPRPLYDKAGGHEAVRGRILENFVLSERILSVGGECRCASGRGVISFRMFPEGFAQLYEGWTKAFADGASGSDGLILLVSIAWLSAMTSVFLIVLFGGFTVLPFALAGYLAFALQLYALACQIGSYRFTTSLLYPIPLVFFFTLFARALLRKQRKEKARWRGREV
jgi:4,4'-diaponeurosporenoate glycosyltransferase